MTHLLYLTESLCPQSWMFFLLPQKKHFLHFTPFWYRVFAETLNYFSEILRKWQHIFYLRSQLYTLHHYEIQMTGFDLQVQISLPVSKLPDNSSKKKKNRRRKYQLLSVEKKSQRTQLFVLQKSNSHQQHSSTISIWKLMNWDTLWKQNGWTEKYFIAEK